MKNRIITISREFGSGGRTIGRQVPEKRLKDKDKRRAAYYKFYTDFEWGNARNYHMALDSGALGIEKCTEIIVSMF